MPVTVTRAVLPKNSSKEQEFARWAARTAEYDPLVPVLLAAADGPGGGGGGGGLLAGLLDVDSLSLHSINCFSDKKDSLTRSLAKPEEEKAHTGSLRLELMS